ncbi:MAG TPA: hypothetical protein VGS57_19215 [Thermoanaerobaculia bacterium]|jgi:hypothetical protein|nr:hypothetical protein [Thermoanaerobaculia bacterium]
MRFEERLIHVLGIAGTSTALAGTLLRAFAKTDQSLYWSVVGASLVVLWLTFYVHALRTRRHEVLVEAALHGHLAPRRHENLEDVLMTSVLRAGAFGGSEIDTVFWAAYGKLLLSDTKRSILDKVRELVDALRSSTVTIEGDKVHLMMNVLLRTVLEQGDLYRATADLSELANRDARMLILGIPQYYPAQVIRIILVEDLTALSKQPEVVREDLRQQVAAGVRLSYLEVGQRRTESIPNIGIYGSAAVGEYDSKSHRNIVRFDRDYAAAKIAEFAGYLARARPVTQAILGEPT